MVKVNPIISIFENTVSHGLCYGWNIFRYIFKVTGKVSHIMGKDSKCHFGTVYFLHIFQVFNLCRGQTVPSSPNRYHIYAIRQVTQIFYRRRSGCFPTSEPSKSQLMFWLFISSQIFVILSIAHYRLLKWNIFYFCITCYYNYSQYEKTKDSINYFIHNNKIKYVINYFLSHHNFTFP